ncbi:MAG: hypothetical protein GX864_01605 [Mollicutes bacterium]|jgi:hypothetical protein|nr:hypothetical protein [Mollicutes bacterium]
MKENKIIIFLVFIAVLISFGLGISFAYFSINVVGNDTASSQLITTGELKLNYQGSDYLELDNAEPGDFGFFNFTVTNFRNITN